MVDKKISEKDAQSSAEPTSDEAVTDQETTLELPDPDAPVSEPPEEPVADTAFEPEAGIVDTPVTSDVEELETGDQDVQSTETPVADTAFSPDEVAAAAPEEPVEETAPVAKEPAPVPASAATQTIVEKRGGFWPALLGGVIAAALGFLAARADLLDPILPPSLQSGRNAANVEELQNQIASQQGQIDSLRDELADAPVTDLGPLETQVSGFSDEIGALGGRIEEQNSSIEDLSSRLTELEKAPISEGVSETAIAAYEDELSRLQEAMAAQRSEVEALIAEARELDANAAEQARAANAQAAIARLQTALSNGLPFAEEAQEVSEGGIEIPSELTSVAESGVETLSALQARFPTAARNALADVRAETSGTDTGLGAFLQRQLGARSVEPREGNDPDAILSRAEAAVMDGDLSVALEEIEALPETAKSAMSEWVQDARARADAMTAADGLTVNATSN